MLTADSYHDVEYNSHTPDIIAKATVGNSLQDFRCSVSGTSAEGFADVFVVHDSRKSEV